KEVKSKSKFERAGNFLTGIVVECACEIGKEEFGFATATLECLACMRMGLCHKDKGTV
ncbi:glutamate synthase-related protein, partial [Staphylococcus aureus]